ncbi:bacterioferritin [Salinisphaera hydrothermalis]|uniref:Bacterioferritin n=1 Tax=Salinisphaera hydrothermalis (strain C41B8) TaxID=1304275 RepID=A0A084III8_SALHC|nr:bacterioferritin [Salinisphaera hydrothermalis]KEZ76522.1 bacterioferritin [Salinisphaera hydrothermalis C41B8]
MKGDATVIKYLQEGLKLELTAINQYFLHARMYEDMGFFELGKHEYNESIEEMHHADRFIKRILFLNGLPNLQDLGKLRIGEKPQEMLECDLAAEYEGHAHYKEAIKVCEEAGDYATRDLFVEILADEEEHIDYIETQLDLIKSMGEANYLQSQTGPNINQTPDAE